MEIYFPRHFIFRSTIMCVCVLARDRMRILYESLRFQLIFIVYSFISFPIKTVKIESQRVAHGSEKKKPNRTFLLLVCPTRKTKQLLFDWNGNVFMRCGW